MNAPAQQGGDAVRYSRLRRQLMLLELAANLLWLAFFQLSGLSLLCARGAAAFDAHPAIHIALCLAIFGAATTLVMLPMHYYSGYVVERRFQLSRMSLKSWFVKQLKHLAVSAVIGLAVVEGLYAILYTAPHSWPLWATLAWVIFSVVLARIFPTVLLPIFYKTTPVRDEVLVQRLLRLCAQVNLPALGVFQFNMGAETRKANAALAGLGSTRRVLLSDTLIKEFKTEEIEGVLAHELGHHHYRHIAKNLVISAAGSGIAFSLTSQVCGWWIGALGLEGLTDIAGFPMLMLWLSLLGLAGMPLQNGLSRFFEWQSDRFALGTTAAPKAFAEALKRLAALNLADPNPPKWVVWFFYDHPPITERIQAAEQAMAHD